MGDLDIKFSGGKEEKKPNISLDLRLKNGQFQSEEKPQPKVEELLKEEYYENLLDMTAVQDKEADEGEGTLEEVTSQLAEEIFEDIQQEVAEETAEADEGEGASEEVTSQLAEEIFEDIQQEVAEETAESDEGEGTLEEVTSQLAEEIFEDIQQEVVEETAEADEGEVTLEEVTAELSGDEKKIISDANEVSLAENPSDELLGELSFDVQKGKYDFINGCVLVLMLVFLSLTFILMKEGLAGGEKAELSVEGIRTGEYTLELSEKYYKNLPMDKIMAQGEVLVKKIFGDKDAQFIKFVENEPPDGPVDNESLGGMSVEGNEEPVVTTAASQTGEVTTTGKLPQDFEITTSEEKGDDSPVFTGRPIRTTTTRKATTLDLPKTTDETTTGEVNLIFP